MHAIENRKPLYTIITCDCQAPSNPAIKMVGKAGFEPTTSSSRTKHATKLRHTPREATTAYRTGVPRSQTPAQDRFLGALGVAMVSTFQIRKELERRRRYTHQGIALTRQREAEMTGLGALVYVGFFALAALWLFVTGRAEGQGQYPERSNSSSTAAGSEGSSPWLVTHSLSK